jgi:hypothetical protein
MKIVVQKPSSNQYFEILNVYSSIYYFFKVHTVPYQTH